ncbi:phosphopantetheine-binding protein [Vibrio splendidus]|uniref:phosphopantetheine-binding protein n=2 Tax=Vibrio splendidus TaxID=29497 RepID=UPI0021594143|nr:phosphopantetheine-binding protein [Vibrio splendidus]
MRYQQLSKALGIKEENMKYLKLVFCSVLAITYSNFVWASSCDAVDDKLLDVMAKTLNVHMDEIAIDKTFYDQNFDTDVLDLITVVVDMEEAIGVELKDEDVVDPIVYFDEEEFEPKIKDKVTVREFQETVHKACVNSLG